MRRDVSGEGPWRPGEREQRVRLTLGLFALQQLLSDLTTSDQVLACFRGEFHGLSMVFDAGTLAVTVDDMIETSCDEITQRDKISGLKTQSRFSTDYVDALRAEIAEKPE